MAKKPRDSNPTDPTTVPHDAAPATPSRRAFLKTGAVGLGGLAVGAAGGAAVTAAVTSQQASPFDPLAPRSEPGFDH
ncbi:MAG TPA: hypothetical protein PLY47_11525, partial [Rhodoglobus sp.]|nr:hypothetical protein [Rhodoglobus sp.]